MNADEGSPKRLAIWLKARGLDSVALTVLDVAGPFSLIGAQLAYVLQPWAKGSGVDLGSLARVLEDPERRAELVRALQEEQTT